MTTCLSLVLVGCVTHEVSPNPVPAGVDAEAESTPFSNAPQSTARRSFDPWWESIREPALNHAIEMALAQNPDVRSIEHRIDQAAARVTQAGSTLFPQVDASADYGGQRDRLGDRQSESSLGLLLDWEIDVWGRIRSGRAARSDELTAAVEDWRAARLFLTTGLAETWFSLAEQRLQRDLVADQIELNETLLRLTRLRFGQGQGSSVDVLQQQQQLEATHVLLPDIDANIAELALALEFLTGQIAGKSGGFPKADTLSDLPRHPKTGVPSELLDLRPDLRAQRARVRAIDHEVGEALADRLPRFSISAGGGLAGTPSLDRLVASAVANAVGPILDGGNRRAEVARQRARLEEEIDLFTSLYLDAARETETALVRERGIQRRLDLQEKQLDTARKLLTESRNQYSQGLTDYLPVLDAVSRVQQLERDLITSRRERLTARISLHRALGGPIPST